MPMPVPRPVRPGLVATPSCFFFFYLKSVAGLPPPLLMPMPMPTPVWVGGRSLLSVLFFFLRKECDGLTILFAHTHANACAF